ncbi:hypothetical protein IMZ48_00575 [Candidatus Bathyarchaeota archaeon]|nr:hypothetical protein [Candidatus Bathyarchaeota archaeon]
MTKPGPYKHPVTPEPEAGAGAIADRASLRRDTEPARQSSASPPASSHEAARRQAQQFPPHSKK